MEWKEEFDVIVVGSGVGGLSSAIKAHDEGKSVIVLEGSDKLGGVTSYSWGQVWVGNNHLQQINDIPDSKSEVIDYLNFVSGGYAKNDLQNALVDNSIIACRYYEENAGIKWQIIKDYQDYYFGKAPGAKSHGRFLDVEPFDGSLLGELKDSLRRSPHCPWGITHDELMEIGLISDEGKKLFSERRKNDYFTMGPGLIAYLLKAVIDRKIPIRTNHHVEKLFFDEKITGVRISENINDEKTNFNYKANLGVILSTGAYDWNDRFVKIYEHVPEYHSAAPPVVKGDNIILAGGQNALIAVTPHVGEGSMVGFSLPGETNEGKPLFRVGIAEIGLPHAILVNRNGKRFADESFVRDVVAAIRVFNGRTQEHPNIPFYIIFDQNHREKYFFGSIFPGEPLPENFATKANTINELARELDIDEHNLSETIEKFNVFASSGKDSEFKRGEYPWSNKWVGDPRVKPNPNLGPIEKPPYYGVKFTVVATGEGSAGLLINDKANVLDINFQPIKGLFACGNSAAYLDIGSGYQSGFANCRGMTFGFLAGKNV